MQEYLSGLYSDYTPCNSKFSLPQNGNPGEALLTVQGPIERVYVDKPWLDCVGHILAMNAGPNNEESYKILVEAWLNFKYSDLEGLDDVWETK